MESAKEAPAPWWKCVVAGLPELLVGTQFLLVAAGRKPYFDLRPRDLTLLMQAEFLVMHSMAFLGFVALWKPEDGAGKILRGVAFWGLFGLYCVLSLTQGWNYFWVFFGLTFVTYLGLFMNWNSPSAKLQLGARWGIGFLVFILAIGVLGTPKNVGQWTGASSVIRAGAVYFLCLAALEFSGLFLRVVPRNAEAIHDALRRGQRNNRD